MERRRAIGVDARAFGSSGLGRYLSEILARIFADERFGRVVLLGDPAVLHPFISEHGAAARVQIGAFGSGLYHPGVQLRWLTQRVLGRLEADVWFFPHYDVPLVAFPPRSVVTVQDLTHFRVPQLFPAWKRAAGGVLLRRAVHSAARLLVSSSATLRDLADRFPGVEDKISVVPLGVGAATDGCGESGCSGCARARELLPYLLCVGNRKPHKNLRTAVEALARLRPEYPELRLVVVGRDFGEPDGVRERAGELGVDGAVVELGAVSDAELRCLYTQAEALLFPSLYEGFGLPILEAMACGTPVVASERASIPEVVGDAGLLADPADAESFARAVRRLIEDSGLRNELVRRGRIRAGEFSWDRTAADTIRVLLATAGADTAVSRAPAVH